MCYIFTIVKEILLRKLYYSLKFILYAGFRLSVRPTNKGHRGFEILFLAGVELLCFVSFSAGFLGQPNIVKVFECRSAIG